MKNIKFYVCRICGNVIYSAYDALVSCCGNKLTPLTAQKAAEEDKLNVERIENEWFITTSHPMSKEHNISFLAFVTGEAVYLIKKFPEWNLDTRISISTHGKLVWHCTDHGLFYQFV